MWGARGVGGGIRGCTSVPPVAEPGQFTAALEVEETGHSEDEARADEEGPQEERGCHSRAPCRQGPPQPFLPHLGLGGATGRAWGRGHREAWGRGHLSGLPGPPASRPGQRTPLPSGPETLREASPSVQGPWPSCPCLTAVAQRASGKRGVLCPPRGPGAEGPLSGCSVCTLRAPRLSRARGQRGTWVSSDLQEHTRTRDLAGWA